MATTLRVTIFTLGLSHGYTEGYPCTDQLTEHRCGQCVVCGGGVGVWCAGVGRVRCGSAHPVLHRVIHIEQRSNYR